MPTTPALPGDCEQPDAATKAEIEAKWNAMKNAIVTLADLILWLNKHPEIIELAKVARVNLTPGATP